MSFYELSKEKNKLENLIKKIETKSAEAEENLKQLELDFVNPEIASDFAKLMDIQAKTESTQILVDKLASDWLEKTEDLEKVKTAIDEITQKNSE